MKPITLLLLAILSTSCIAQEKPAATNESNTPSVRDNVAQIGQYVVSTFADSEGNLWFGTLEFGVAKYDGNSLVYYTTSDGLPSSRVTSVMEDADHNLWFGTGAGVAKYDGKTFITYPIKDDFFHNMTSSLYLDSKNTFWVGTWGGVYTFDGEAFTYFPLPYPEVDTPINPDTKNWITEITEDPAGNIWFARDGYGACKYDGKTFTHVLKKDGLHSNNITGITFDDEGSTWFGTRVAEKDNPAPEQRTGSGGVNRLINGSIQSFPEIAGFNTNDAYEVFKDQKGNIWVSTLKNGVYRYDGEQFKNYAVPISITNMVNDKKGNLWLGGAGGLYRIDTHEAVVNVKQNGPWR